MTIKDLNEGRDLYIRHCSGCHGLYRPNEYPTEHWEKIMPEMALKAKIGKEEAQQISRYLMTMSFADTTLRK